MQHTPKISKTVFKTKLPLKKFSQRMKDSMRANSNIYMVNKSLRILFRKHITTIDVIDNNLLCGLPMYKEKKIVKL